MESKEELKEIDIKSRTCHSFVNIIKDRDINFNEILLDEKLYKKEYENTLTYDISYKTATGGKPLRFRFDKIDRFIRNHGDEIRHLVLFDCGLFDKICDRINYLISEKSCITDSINNDFGKIRTDSYNYLPIEKILTFHNTH